MQLAINSAHGVNKVHGLIRTARVVHGLVRGHNRVVVLLHVGRALVQIGARDLLARLHLLVAAREVGVPVLARDGDGDFGGADAGDGAHPNDALAHDDDVDDDAVQRDDDAGAHFLPELAIRGAEDAGRRVAAVAGVDLTAEEVELPKVLPAALLAGYEAQLAVEAVAGCGVPVHEGEVHALDVARDALAVHERLHPVDVGVDEGLAGGQGHFGGRGVDGRVFCTRGVRNRVQITADNLDCQPYI